jgi:hypothetical protein
VCAQWYGVGQKKKVAPANQIQSNWLLDWSITATACVVKYYTRFSSVVAAAAAAAVDEVRTCWVWCLERCMFGGLYRPPHLLCRAAVGALLRAHTQGRITSTNQSVCEDIKLTKHSQEVPTK